MTVSFLRFGTSAFFSCLLTLTVFLPNAFANTNEQAVNPLLFELEMQSVSDDAAKIELLMQTLQTVRKSEGTDPQFLFDLYTDLADLFEKGGQEAKAVEVLAVAVDFAAMKRDLLEVNLAALYRRLGALFDKVGNVRKAYQAYEQELAERRQGMQFGPAVARVMEDLSRLAAVRGLAADASRYEKAAKGEQQASRPEEAKAARSDGKGGYREVEVYYATDRAETKTKDLDNYYGYQRGDLQYGVVTVSVPEIHVAGAVEAPSIWKLEFSADPSKHVMVQKIEPEDVDSYFARMQKEFTQKGKKEAFVFVHGYNVTFDSAAKRAAQLAYDMNYSGVPVLYSWPSAGKTTRYIGDTAVVRLSGRRLAGFLEDLKQRSGATTIHIVAHSMGNRALTDALELVALRNQDKVKQGPLFGQVFFAAPDVDAGLFVEMAKTIRPVAKRLTLYTSEEDWALKTSRELHGNAIRAGQGGSEQAVSANFDTIDMTGLGSDMLSHSYFADDSSAIADMMSLIWRNANPDKRCGLVKQASASGAPSAWKYTHSDCASRDFLAILASLRQIPSPTLKDVRAFVKKYVSDADLRKSYEAELVSLLN
ncbi:alpha/beta fold hydrolase [uncultured Cohaesibacter sp.]|uniref:alpha/beta hydrolase n=1 Tax=uncultured Cohaesibacter sp. TaxID=1002546 RepID=UPI00292F4754|nr:alpha/beta fold hydrolase [uncultured Cohaesibacter sp.]